MVANSASRSRRPASRSGPPSLGRGRISEHGADANELIHQADLAVYRAKLQGRNRVLTASSEPLLLAAELEARLTAVPDEPRSRWPAPRGRFPNPEPVAPRRAAQSRPHATAGPRFVALSRRSPRSWPRYVGGFMAGVLGFVYGGSAATYRTFGSRRAGGRRPSACARVRRRLDLGQRCRRPRRRGDLRHQAALPLAIATAAVDWSGGREPATTALQRRRAPLASLRPPRLLRRRSARTMDGS